MPPSFLLGHAKRSARLRLFVFVLAICGLLTFNKYLLGARSPDGGHHSQFPPDRGAGGAKMRQPKKGLKKGKGVDHGQPKDYLHNGLVNHPGYQDTDLGGTVLNVPVKTDKNAPQHTYLPNGLVVPNPEGQHPIFDLIARARREWEEKLDKASLTLTEAVTEYRRRYSRQPPKGFDRWWAWAKANNVQLPDEYDQIHHDLEPFFAFHPSKLEELSRKAMRKSGVFNIRCHSGKCKYNINEEGMNEEGRVVAKERAEDQIDLLRTIQNELEDVNAVYYSHDVPFQFQGHDYKDSLKEAASIGEYADVMPSQFDSTNIGWGSACAPTKPLRDPKKNKRPNLDELWIANKTFVWNHMASMDPCTNPDLVYLSGFLSGFGKGPEVDFDMFPIMSMSKTFLHSDILGVQSEGWTEDVEIDPPWEDKIDHRLVWRGKTTGIVFGDEFPWNISQRINLLSHAKRTDGDLPILDSTKPLAPVGVPHKQAWRDINNRLVDISFVEGPIQCEPHVCRQLAETYQFAERMTFAQANLYKYQLDLDGNGWSARFKRLMSTNSLVLKSTIFPEWYSDRIQPWVHYIPIKPDLTDLYDVMTFFQTDNDALAKQIAATGKIWSKTFWRREDMVSYQFRLLLELSRLLAPDRDVASFHLPTEKRDP